jgi:hypothetical protein
MDDEREWLRASQASLERMQNIDRDRARARLRTVPDALTDYEQRLLGVEYSTVMRRRAAEQTAARERRPSASAALRPTGIIFRNPLLARLNAHAIDLVVRAGLRARRSPDGGGWACAETRTISVPLPINEAGYAVTLHEVAHLTDAQSDSRQFRNWIEDGRLLSVPGELNAWRWAVAHALEWRLEMQEQLYASLQHHPAYRRATADERSEMSLLLSSACFRVTGPTWTFGQLDAKCAAVRRADKTDDARPVRPTANQDPEG